MACYADGVGLSDICLTMLLHADSITRVELTDPWMKSLHHFYFSSDHTQLQRKKPFSENLCLVLKSREYRGWVELIFNRLINYGFPGLTSLQMKYFAEAQYLDV